MNKANKKLTTKKILKHKLLFKKLFVMIIKLNTVTFIKLYFNF